MASFGNISLSSSRTRRSNGGVSVMLPNTLIFSTATFMTRHLDLVEWRSEHLSVLAQTISDLDMCRFGGIDALDRWYMAHHSSTLRSLFARRSYGFPTVSRHIGSRSWPSRCAGSKGWTLRAHRGSSFSRSQPNFHIC